MKRRGLIKAGLLSAVLLLGTGYATINNRVLTATGTVPIATKEMDVRITGLSGTFSSNEYSISPDGHTLTISAEPFDYNFEEYYSNEIWIYLGITNYEEFNIGADSSIVVTLKKGTENKTYFSDSFVGGIFDGPSGANEIEYIEPGINGWIEFCIPIDVSVLNYETMEISITVEAFPVFE